MPTSYEIRAEGDGKKKKQSMVLRRLDELNRRLQEDLDRPREDVAQAAARIIYYCNTTRDYMVPSVWGTVDKREDPYAPQQSKGCCTVM